MAFIFLINNSIYVQVSVYLSVCLSVRLSVTSRCSIKSSKPPNNQADIFKVA